MTSFDLAEMATKAQETSEEGSSFESTIHFQAQGEQGILRQLGSWDVRTLGAMALSSSIVEILFYFQMFQICITIRD